VRKEKSWRRITCKAGRSRRKIRIDTVRIHLIRYKSFQ
jgi:hypothetical protein